MTPAAVGLPVAVQHQAPPVRAGLPVQRPAPPVLPVQRLAPPVRAGLLAGAPVAVAAAGLGRRAALEIGPLSVDPPVVLAPMAGVTTAAFRTLCRRFGAGLYVSEMITARALVEGSARTLRMLAPGPDEPVRSIQLYGVDPEVVAAAVRRLVDDVGVDHVDLNFGCPAPKVTRKGGGAALPAHPGLFRRIVAAAVRAAGAVPVTVKLRIGIDDGHRTAVTSALAAEEVGAAAVTLHARTAQQLYSGAADWSAIAEVKAEVRSIPVLGNGDIWDAADALAMMEATGCDGVVIGRGCLGRPWLFADLTAAFSGRPAPSPPRLGEVAAIMRLHAALLAEQDGEDNAVRDFRKHAGWYLTGYPVGGAARRALGLIDSLATLDRLLGELDGSLGLPDGAPALPRGHSAGPRPVALPAGWLETADDLRPPVGADALVSGG